jgi:hypothetical protein
MSAYCEHKIPSMKNCIHVEKGFVTIHQEAIFANAKWGKDLMAQILDANL